MAPVRASNWSSPIYAQRSFVNEYYLVFVQVFVDGDITAGRHLFSGYSQSAGASGDGIDLEDQQLLS